MGFLKGIVSCGSEAGRRSPQRLNTMVFHTKISNSEVRHDLRIPYNSTPKAVNQPRKSDVTISASDRQE